MKNADNGSITTFTKPNGVVQAKVWVSVSPDVITFNAGIEQRTAPNPVNSETILNFKFSLQNNDIKPPSSRAIKPIKYVFMSLSQFLYNYCFKTNKEWSQGGKYKKVNT